MSLPSGLGTSISARSVRDLGSRAYAVLVTLASIAGPGRAWSRTIVASPGSTAAAKSSGTATETVTRSARATTKSGSPWGPGTVRSPVSTFLRVTTPSKGAVILANPRRASERRTSERATAMPEAAAARSARALSSPARLCARAASAVFTWASISSRDASAESILFFVSSRRLPVCARSRNNCSTRRYSDCHRA